MTFLPNLGPARHQGRRPLCLPIAASDAHAASRSRPQRPVIPLSAEAIWHTCHLRGWATANGTTIDAVEWALSDPGQPTEAQWPYDATLGAAAGARPRDLATDTLLTADLRGLGRPPADRLVGFVARILRHGLPVLCVLMLTSEFFRPRNGVVDAPHPGQNQGRHAVLITDVDTTPGNEHVLVRNSWGSGWGDHGYAWLPLVYLAGYGMAYAVVTAGIASAAPDVPVALAQNSQTEASRTSRDPSRRTARPIQGRESRTSNSGGR